MLAQKLYAFYIPDGNVSLFSFLGFGIPTVLLALAVFPIARADGESYSGCRPGF